MKTCSRCNQEKELAEFNKKASSKDGHCEACRECMKLVKREAYKRDHEKLLIQQKEYRDANKAKVSESKKRSRLKKYDEYRARENAAYHANREQILAAAKARRSANRGEWLKKERATYRRNAATRIASQKAYYLANKDSRNAYGLAYAKKRYASDPLYALGRLTRRRITLALSAQGYLKTSPTQAMLGCSYEELQRHLESQFHPGMTWENRGTEGWHVDHIIPLASAKNEEELIKLCHYANLQPLWAADNLAKGARV